MYKEVLKHPFSRSLAAVAYKWFVLTLFFISACSKGTHDPLEQAKGLVDAKKYKKAISHYHKQIHKAKDLEEVWFSKYMVGVCHENLGSWNEAFSWYLDAYQTDPTRPEPLQKISSYACKEKMNDLAYHFAKYGSLLSLNKGRFKDPEYAAYKFDEVLSIASYYTQFKDDGFKAANDLLLNRDVPWHVKDRASKNILFYAQNLPNVRFKEIEITIPPREGDDGCYFPMNPSISKTKEGYHVLCRTMSCHQERGWLYTPTAKDGVVRTRNFLQRYTKDFTFVSQVEIEDSIVSKTVEYSPLVQGLEDCRFFSYGTDNWLLCTLPMNPVYRMALCRLGNRVRDEKLHIELCTPLVGPDPNRHEKNWLPFEKEGKLHVLYSSDPFIVYLPDLDTGECVPMFQYDPPYDFSRFRGSAAPIAFDNGYLMLIHEVTFFMEEKRRIYSHRFVYLDEDFHIKKVSKPFTFKHQGVEYCCGMTLNHEQDELVITIGIEDNQAMLMFVDVKDVLKTLGDYG